MADARSELSGESSAECSCDAWFGGRLTLVQPRRGHRVGSDAALLAAAADFAEGRFADVGAGVGAVALAILSRRKPLTADLIEIDSGLACLALDNAIRNGFGDCTRIRSLDICDARARSEAGLTAEAASAVVTNPPFFEPDMVRVSPDDARAQAHVLTGSPSDGAPLVRWIRACLTLLKPGGRFVMIHRPEALPPILTAAENRLGALALMPVHPRASVAAHRLLVSGVKGSKAPLRIVPALVLHEADGKLTPEADEIHRGEALIDWGGVMQH